MTILSDRGTAILSSLNRFYKKAFLKPCPKHIEGNLKKLKYSEELINLYWKAERAKTKTEHKDILEQMAAKPKG